MTNTERYARVIVRSGDVRIPVLRAQNAAERCIVMIRVSARSPRMEADLIDGIREQATLSAHWAYIAMNAA